jgi:hypothetical protein
MAALIDWLALSGARKSDGTTVASGTATFYSPGTSTRTAVYGDEDGIAVIAQPVKLDASGRAKVYAKSVVDVEVKDAFGVVVRSQGRADTFMAQQVEVENDSFTGIGLTTFTPETGGRATLDDVLKDATFSLGSEDFLYREVQGAFSRNVRDPVGRWISPSDFGAKGNDSADDTAPMQACISRAAASGKSIWIEPGIYRVSATLLISGVEATRLVMVGASRPDCVFRNMADGLDLMRVDIGAGAISHVAFRNFSITAQTISTGAGIALASGDGTVVEHVTTALHRNAVESSVVTDTSLYDCVATSTDGTSSGVAFNLGIRASAIRCRVTQATGGVGFSLAGAGAHAMNCTASSAATGFQFVANDTSVLFCQASSCTTGYGIGAFARVGPLFSSGSGNTTDFSTNAGAVDVTDIGNNFATRTRNEYGGTWLKQPRQQVLKRARTAAVGPGISWTPTIDAELQTLVVTGVGAGTTTINNTVTTGLQDGHEMWQVISNETGGSMNFAYGTQYIGGHSAATVVGNKLAVTRWVWRASSSKWLNILGGRNVFSTPNAGEW